MKNTMLLVLACGFLAGGCCTSRRAANWEYKTVVVSLSSGFKENDPGTNDVSYNDEALNLMVQQGWRLAGYSADEHNQLFLLKRPRQ